MNDTDSQFLTCAMDALEEGIPADEIREECACRLGLTVAGIANNNPINPIN